MTKETLDANETISATSDAILQLFRFVSYTKTFAADAKNLRGFKK